MESHRLEKWLGLLGSMAPGAALEVVSHIANAAANRGPLGSDVVRVGTILIRSDGFIELRGHVTKSTAEKDMLFMGGLFYELTTGKQWKGDPSLHASQLDEAYRLLSMWPGGEEAYTLLTDLMQQKAEPDPKHLAIRITQVRERIGGATLAGAIQKAQRSHKRPRYDDFESPDSLTGTYPAGALASVMGGASDEVRQAAAQAVANATPIPPQDDLQSILSDISQAPPSPPSPATPKVKRRAPASTIPLWLIGAIGLAVLGIAGVIVVLILF